MREHLHIFLAENSDTVIYEEWIKQLHPETDEFDDDRIDHRYYTEDSDHRRMWNECMMERDVDCAEKLVDSRHILPSYNRKLPSQAQEEPSGHQK